jgi:GDPmannose 4,6-dehydratase
VLDHGQLPAANGLDAFSGIPCNHQIPLRGETFVLGKTARAIARIARDLPDYLYLGIRLRLDGEGSPETATVESVEGNRVCVNPGQVVRVDPRYCRPSEVETLLGNLRKSNAELGWTPKIGLPELVHEMVSADYAAAQRDSLVEIASLQAYEYNE